MKKIIASLFLVPLLLTAVTASAYAQWPSWSSENSSHGNSTVPSSININNQGQGGQASQQINSQANTSGINGSSATGGEKINLNAGSGVNLNAGSGINLNTGSGKSTPTQPVTNLAPTQPTTPVTTPNPTPPATPTQPTSPSSPTTSSLQLGAFNAKVGTIQAYFDGWTDSASCAPSGQQTFIYWENYGVSLDSIINGSQDSNIQRFASTICPGTTLNLFAEMNGNWDDWDGTVGDNTPAKVIQAWQHIHNIIGNKVKWAWVVNDSSVPDVSGNQPSDYYPGSSYVDIVGVDGFNWGGQTFMQAIAPAFPSVQSFGKPVWITSFGTSQSNQAAWITDAITQAKANGISGLIYFSAPDSGGTSDNFTLSSSGLAAYHS